MKDRRPVAPSDFCKSHMATPNKQISPFKLKGDICLLGVAIWLLQKSDGATGLLSFIFGAAAYFALRTKRMKWAKRPAMFYAVLGFTLALPTFGLSLSPL